MPRRIRLADQGVLELVSLEPRCGTQELTFVTCAKNDSVSAFWDGAYRRLAGGVHNLGSCSADR
jgi:hypothetical protein